MRRKEQQDTSSPKNLKLSDDQRFQVLMAQMNERYQAWHHMRARSMQFTLWILGLAIAASWKLLQEPCGESSQRIATTALVLLLGGAATYFLKSLERGVNTNRKALINVETALSTHELGAFLNNKAILPAEYKTTRPRASSHFYTLYALLAVTSIYLLAAIWFPSHSLRELDKNRKQHKCLSPCHRDMTHPLTTTNTHTQLTTKGSIK